MRGHEPLLAMRRSGHVPDWIYLDVDHDRLQSWRDWSEIDHRTARVLIEPTDRHFDFRFAVGLPCYVSGSVLSRVHAVRDALIEANASRVIASVLEPSGEGEFTVFRVVECTDTASHFDMERIDG